MGICQAKKCIKTDRRSGLFFRFIRKMKKAAYTAFFLGGKYEKHPQRWDRLVCANMQNRRGKAAMHVPVRFQRKRAVVGGIR